MPVISFAILRRLQASTLPPSVPSIPTTTTTALATSAGVKYPAGNVPAVACRVKLCLTKREDDDDDWKYGAGERSCHPKNTLPKPPPTPEILPWHKSPPGRSEMQSTPEIRPMQGPPPLPEDMPPIPEISPSPEMPPGSLPTPEPPFSPLEYKGILPPSDLTLPGPAIPETEPIPPNADVNPLGDNGSPPTTPDNPWQWPEWDTTWDPPPIEPAGAAAPNAETPPAPEMPPVPEISPQTGSPGPLDRVPSSESLPSNAEIGEWGLHYFGPKGEVNMETGELTNPLSSMQGAPNETVYWFGSEGEISPLNGGRIHHFRPDGEIDPRTGELITKPDSIPDSAPPARDQFLRDHPFVSPPPRGNRAGRTVVERTPTPWLREGGRKRVQEGCFDTRENCCEGTTINRERLTTCSMAIIPAPAATTVTDLATGIPIGFQIEILDTVQSSKDTMV